jgi:hypothetical protein
MDAAALELVCARAIFSSGTPIRVYDYSTGWLQRISILMTNRKPTWGSSGDDNEEPRSPWSIPPGGNRSRPKPTTLDEFLRRAARHEWRRWGQRFSGFPIGGGGGKAIWLIGSGLVMSRYG